MKKYLILLILVFFTSSTLAQLYQGKIKQKYYLQEIPYQEIKGIPIIQVSINGKMYNFAFDTGASLILSDKIFKELFLPVICRIGVSSATGGIRKMRYISLPELHIQDIIFLKSKGIVTHEDYDFFDCLGIDGVIGSNMVRNSVVQFDEQNKRIIITNDINNVLNKKSEGKRMHLSPIQKAPYIKITLQKENKKTIHKVGFDSGQSSLYRISMRDLNRNADVIDKIAESEGIAGWDIHGIPPKQKRLLLSIPEFVVNGTTFNDVIVTTTQSKTSRIGAKLLQYGKITLDYKKKRFYFEPFGNIDTLKLSEKPWGISRTFINNKMVVGIIWDKGLESQINLGDEILSINGIDIRSMDFCELFMTEIITDSDRAIFELKDIKTGETKKVEIKRM